MSICLKQRMKKKRNSNKLQKRCVTKKALPQKGFSSVFRCIEIEMITKIKSKLKIVRHICNVSLFKLKTVDYRLQYGLANVNGLVLWYDSGITHIYGRERNTTRNIENLKLVCPSVKMKHKYIRTLIKTAWHKIHPQCRKEMENNARM